MIYFTEIIFMNVSIKIDLFKKLLNCNTISTKCLFL